MIWDLLLGFVVVVIGTYVGSTMALRGFFGREYDDPRTGQPVGDEQEANDDVEG